MLEYFQGPRYLIALQVWVTPPGGTVSASGNLVYKTTQTATNSYKYCFGSNHRYEWDNLGGSGPGANLAAASGDPALQALVIQALSDEWIIVREAAAQAVAKHGTALNFVAVIAIVPLLARTPLGARLARPAVASGRRRGRCR